MPNELVVYEGQGENIPLLEGTSVRNGPEDEPNWIEGEWEDITPPSHEGFWSRLKSKGKAYRESYEEDFINEVRRKARKWGYPEPATYEEAKDIANRIAHEEEFSETRRRAKLEEERAYERAYKGKYRRDVGKTIGKAWKTTKEVLGPKAPIKGLYVPKPSPSLYVPRAPIKMLTEQTRELQRTVKPEMGTESSLGKSVLTDTGSLKRAGSPPPTPVIKAPARSPEEYEGLGPALVRLRKLGELKKVDQAVLSEVQANGDIDVPTHVKSQVGRLGFSTKEIDDSLRRLRDLGFIVPTGRVFNGEKELMLSGGSHG